MSQNCYERLSRAEDDIQALLERNRSNWQEVAKIAIAVREDKLYQQSGLSFTAWVQQMAERCDCQRSLIWRYIKAGKYYLRTIESDSIEQIDSALAAPEALVNLEKVERHAPKPVFQGLKDKVLAGMATVRECRDMAKQYKPESENRRGRPPAGSEGTYEHLGRQNSQGSGSTDSSSADSSFADGDLTTSSLATNDISSIGISPVAIREAVTGLMTTGSMPPGAVAQNIVQTLSFTLVDWTKRCAGMRYPPKHYVAHTEVRVSHRKKRLRLDYVSVIRWSNKRPKEVFGVEIKSSLADFEHDQKWPLYLQFCDYFCFAVPAENEELIDAVQTVVPEAHQEVGILAVDTFNTDAFSNEVEVLRSPAKLKGESKYLLYETLYERALGWSGAETSGAGASGAGASRAEASRAG
ncbi:hypothetical protein C1752_10977 [Acaryochloris thomasi RCC1774]|uniref:Uncharacterized protein n=1 Tax=Acaryochloris thomasi RCC1774 TaxID=1764569 RepID=A0A2W1J8U1_9CYAN|nr:MmcB family DNA repair protein [Acaryochloris thomasi]PZD70548.1 hypothetical protein C1752_10977 [Acaryochloris thomasi RCC1774]